MLKRSFFVLLAILLIPPTAGVAHESPASTKSVALDPSPLSPTLTPGSTGFQDSATNTPEESVQDDFPIERICEALVDAANLYELPAGFFARLIWQESRFDRWAMSPAGARGVAQFMPQTAVEFGLDDPFNPIDSVSASAKFLRQLRDQFGNLGLAAAAYNAGGGRIKKWLNGQSSLPEETRNYVQIITGHAPRRWTIEKPIAINFALPRNAPCDGFEGLPTEASQESIQVSVTRATAALLESARKAKQAAQRTNRKRMALAKRKSINPRAKSVRVASAKIP